MKKFLTAILFAPVLAFAAGPTLHLDSAPDRSSDMAALQNGAKVFVNYCLNCHSASYMRYNRLRDIGLSDAQIKDNLMFTADKAKMGALVAPRWLIVFAWVIAVTIIVLNAKLLWDFAAIGG